MPISKSLIKQTLNRECVIVIKKLYVVVSKDVEIKDRFVIAINDNGVKHSINQTSITSIVHFPDKGFIRTCYTSPCLIRGKVVELDKESILIKIHDMREDKHYMNIIPLDEIQGIKINYYLEDEEEGVDVSEEHINEVEA